MRVTLLFLLLAFAPSRGFAQAATPDDSEAAPSTSTTPARRRPSHEAPCWRQAGIAPNLVNQRWKIEDQAKARVAAACNEEKTSAQQKHDKIEQIHHDRDLAITQLIPPKQLEAFNSCEAALEKKHPKPAGAKELGPCGGVIPKTPSTMPGMDHSDHH